jgi:hypothetical protein
MSYRALQIAVAAYATLLHLATLHAADDPAIAAIERARSLLAKRGHVIATVIVLERWPSGVLSGEAFATGGTIYVNQRSNVLRASMRRRRYDVALASLLLHEQSHLAGASERQALETELDWLTINQADAELIQATKRSIELEIQRENASGADRSRPR